VFVLLVDEVMLKYYHDRLVGNARSQISPKGCVCPRARRSILGFLKAKRNLGFVGFLSRWESESALLGLLDRFSYLHPRFPFGLLSLAFGLLFLVVGYLADFLTDLSFDLFAFSLCFLFGHFSDMGVLHLP
jgi:hypothetical protein